MAASPPDAPKPTAIEQFVADHPSVPAATATLATPESFATEEYHGINAFILINQADEQQAVRYRMLPEESVHLSAEDAADRAPDFLVAELSEPLSAGPIKFLLKAQLAAEGDPTDDATKPWPADRQLVDLGELIIDKAVEDGIAADESLLFLPGAVIDGIEPSDDPLIGIRDGAYAESFARRSP